MLGSKKRTGGKTEKKMLCMLTGITAVEGSSYWANRKDVAALDVMSVEQVEEWVCTSRQEHVNCFICNHRLDHIMM